MSVQIKKEREKEKMALVGNVVLKFDGFSMTMIYPLLDIFQLDLLDITENLDRMSFFTS